jgi:hypothetical protein
MNWKYFIIIMAGFLVIIFFIVMIIMKDPFFIILGIIFGIIFILTITAEIIEHFFPKSNLSKKLYKISEWIRDNIIP